MDDNKKWTGISLAKGTEQVWDVLQPTFPGEMEQDDDICTQDNIFDFLKNGQKKIDDTLQTEKNSLYN